MFDIGWPELFIIAVVVLLVVGPKDLPRCFGRLVTLPEKPKPLLGNSAAM